MPTPEQVAKCNESYEKLEEAIQAHLRNVFEASEHESPETMFLQDWSLALSAEDMREGYGNKTYHRQITRNGMAYYSVLGLMQHTMDILKHSRFHND